MKIAAIAKVIKDRGSCRLYRVHGSDDLETKFYIGTNSEIYSLEGFPKPWSEAEVIKNISPCITNEVAVVVKICVFFNAEHNSPHTIHAQLHTNQSFQHHKPVRSSTRRAFRFCDYFSFGFSGSGGALRLRMICGASGAAPCSLAYRAISSGSPTGKPFSSSGPS